MKSRIFLKLFFAALLVIAACTLTLAGLIRQAWEGMLRSEIEASLRQKTYDVRLPHRGDSSPLPSGRPLRQAARPHMPEHRH